jgi:preprotein translocase subunit SecF
LSKSQKQHRSKKVDIALIALFVISLLFSINALRQNNLNMVKQRDEVYSVDKSGGDINTSLNKLRDYVYSHMNTNLNSGGHNIKPPIQLQYTYQKLQEEEGLRVTEANTALYGKGQHYCHNIGSKDTATCVQRYIANNTQSVQSIPASLYQFDFVSPTWSPDVAGWSLVATLLSGAAIILRIIKRR